MAVAFPGLDYLIKWHMRNVAGGPLTATASTQKYVVLRDANLDWIGRGRPHETINGRLLSMLRAGWTAGSPTQVRLAVAGTPGAFYPATAPIPTAAEMATLRVVVSPFGPWPVGQYILAAGGEPFSWTGFDWVEIAPPVDDYAALVVADGATHYWPLSEASGTTAADTIGSLNGTIVGTVLYGQPGVVAPSTCMVFPNDGSAHIALPSFPSLAGAFTLETWVRLRNIIAAPAGLVMREILTGGDFEYSVGSDALLTFLLIGDTYQTWKAAGPFPLNAWVHLAAVGGAGQFTMYLNGAVAAPGSMAMQLAYPGAGAVALAGSTSAPFGWRGDIQDIAMYPVALTPAQVAAHYAAR